MEVVVPSPRGSPPVDHFDFNYGARISPYLSAPSSPKRFGEYYLSAPTSPSRISEFYSDLEYFSISPSTPFDWEQKPGTPKAGITNNKDGAGAGDGEGKGKGEDGFAFFVSGESERSSRSAEELFDGGKIKPLKENDGLMESAKSPLLSPKQPKRSPIAQGKKVILEALSPKRRKESDNPFTKSNRESGERRGRDRTPAAAISSSNSGRRVTRSHSPYRISHYTWEEEPHHQPQTNKEDSNNASLSSSSSSKSSRKWRLRDLLLFRSASEGRGTSKDPFRKYPVLFKKPEEAKIENPVPRSRRKEPVSAHEMHYARKKAETEDLKKRTFLPYKQGILGRLAGLGSLTR